MVDLRWYGPRDLLELGSFRLPGPLVFTSCVRRNQEPSAISTLDAFGPSWPIRARPMPAPAGAPLSHPTYATIDLSYGRVSYERLSQIARWDYLTWHQEGRPARTKETHLLLFLQGLERRALVGGRDIPLIWTELWRLWSEGQGESGNELRYVESNYTFRHAAEQLLWLLLFRAESAVTRAHIEDLAAALTPYTEHLERALSLLLAWCLQESGHLPSWLAFHFARLAPGARGGVVLERTGEEMRQLFDLRFRRKWGEGVQVTLPPKAQRSLQYDPYNPSLSPTSIHWIDPLGKAATWKLLREELLQLYTACHEEIRPLALALGKAGVTRESMIAWEATPPLFRRSPPPVAKALWQLGADSLRESGYGATSIAAVATALGIEAREALSPETSKLLAASVQRCELGIEPDARLAGKTYKWSEPCVLFQLPKGIPEHPRFNRPVPAELRARYQLCAALLRLALLVARAGGSPSQERLSLIANHFKGTFAWDIHDTRRFKALAGLHLHYGVDGATLRVPSGGSSELLESTTQILLQLASHGGQINASQEEALRLAWKRLGLSEGTLKRRLDDLSNRGVIFIGRFRSSGPGEALPVPSAPPLPGPAIAPLQLDYAAIATLRAETQRVQATLSEAMGSGDESDEEIPNQKVPAPSSPTTRLAASSLAQPPLSPEATLPVTAPITNLDAHKWNGLETRFRPLLQALVERDSWSLVEVQGLARKQGVMFSGALEAINDWAFEALGGALLWEEDDALVVERSLLN